MACKYQESSFGCSALVPSGSNEAKSRIFAPNCFRTDVGVMPHTRPDAISNRVRLSYKVAASIFRRGLIAEHGAVDSLLSTVVSESSPNEKSIACFGSQDDFFTGSAEQFSFSSIAIPVS